MSQVALWVCANPGLHDSFAISKYADLSFLGIRPFSFNTSLLGMMQIRAATIRPHDITQVSVLYFWNLLHTAEASRKVAQAEAARNGD